MTVEQKTILAEIHNSLNLVTVSGANNLNIILGCMNALKDLLKEETDGVERTES